MKGKIGREQLSISEILTESWKYFSKNFRLILAITLIVYIPINILYSLAHVGGLFSNTELSIGVVGFFEAIVSVVAMMAIAHAIRTKMEGKSISVRAAIDKSLSRWGTAIITGLIAMVFILGLSLLLIIPGIIYGVYWMFIIYVVILKGKSGREAMHYSKSIVQGRWWTVLGYTFVFGVLAALFGFVGEVPGIYLPGDFISPLILGTLGDVLLSFFTVVSTVFFVNFDATKIKKVAE